MEKKDDGWSNDSTKKPTMASHDNNSTTMRIQELLHRLILERNAKETYPFQSIHESNYQLSKQVEALQRKLDQSEKEIARMQLELEGSSAVIGASSGSGKMGATAAALKNEARLRDKLEKLQDEYNSKMKQDAVDKADALKSAKRVTELQDLNTKNESLISDLKQQLERRDHATAHLQTEVEDSKSRTELAEKQYGGLKLTIRSLQEENDQMKKENRVLEKRLVGDKEKMVEEMNALTDMVESLRRENERLKSSSPPKPVEPKRSTGWFGTSFTGGGGNKESKQPASPPPRDTANPNAPKPGSLSVGMPSMVRRRIAAHTAEGTCIRFDGSGNNFVATASGDASVKVWDTSTGSLRATLHGSHGHAMTGCDMYGSLVIGAGSDKTCRVWNFQTQRMVRNEVEAAQKCAKSRLSVPNVLAFFPSRGASATPSSWSPAQDNLGATMLQW